MNRILIVEDLPEKADEIKVVIAKAFPNIEIEERTSYHSAIEEIYQNHPRYKLILLDISMSTFDVNVEENGGLPESLAGKRILQGMYLRDIPTKVKVVTMYESFDGKSIKELDRELKEDNPDSYDGFIFFSFKKSEWKKQLVEYLNTVIC
ncbi:MAG: response regulator [Bacteroidales bacterium]|nr:response regulator [Bacteroidales bacterium]